MACGALPRSGLHTASRVVRAWNVWKHAPGVHCCGWHRSLLTFRDETVSRTAVFHALSNEHVRSLAPSTPTAQPFADTHGPRPGRHGLPSRSATAVPRRRAGSPQAPPHPTRMCKTTHTRRTPDELATTPHSLTAARASPCMRTPVRSLHPAPGPNWPEFILRLARRYAHGSPVPQQPSGEPHMSPMHAQRPQGRSSRRCGAPALMRLLNGQFMQAIAYAFSAAPAPIFPI